MKYCTDCIDKHTADCYLRTADYIETCPEDRFAHGLACHRKRWANNLRCMARNPVSEKNQAARNVIAMMVKGVPRLL